MRRQTRELHVRWLRLAGSLKLWVSFAKEPHKRDYVLQKRPIILRSLLIIATTAMSTGVFKNIEILSCALPHYCCFLLCEILSCATLKLSHVEWICERWLILVCNMTHRCDITYSYLWHDFFTSVRWSFTQQRMSCVIWFICICDVVYLNVWHTSHLYVWHVWFIRVTRLVHTCAMTRSRKRGWAVWNHPFTCVTWRI